MTMKKDKTELDVDFIGGQEPLTLEEEKALSDFFKQSKLKAKKTLEVTNRRTTIKKRSKTTTNLEKKH